MHTGSPPYASVGGVSKIILDHTNCQGAIFEKTNFPGQKMFLRK